MNSAQLMFFAPVGVGVLVALTTLFLVLRKRRPQEAFAPSKSSRGSEWDEHDQSFADRRNSVRREGQPVKILVTSPTLRSGQDEGYVLDRSTGGLRIAMKVRIPEGTTVQVRAANAPETVPWVNIVVRSAKPAGQHHEHGCEFEKTPPWNILLLFG
ncbi:MAG: PilZ domain-containing protein [Fimbriiglobus sp.]